MSANQIVLIANRIYDCNVSAACVSGLGSECGDAAGVAIVFTSKVFVPNEDEHSRLEVVGNSLNSSGNTITQCTALQPPWPMVVSQYSAGGMLLLCPDPDLANVRHNSWSSNGDVFTRNQGLEAAGAMHAINIDQLIVNRGCFSSNCVNCPQKTKSSTSECFVGGGISY